jgi:hypothetical protein
MSELRSLASLELGNAAKRVRQNLDTTRKRASEGGREGGRDGGKSRREGSEDSTHASEDSIFLSFLSPGKSVHSIASRKGREENRREEKRT